MDRKYETIKRQLENRLTNRQMNRLTLLVPKVSFVTEKSSSMWDWDHSLKEGSPYIQTFDYLVTIVLKYELDKYLTEHL